MLCGVVIPHSKAFKAHSDGDVGLHALCDALLGACGLGDIGRHFPDTDPAYKDADSRILLRDVVEMLKARGLVCNNADITLIAQLPKLAPYIEQMRTAVAEDLGVSVEYVNVKATTTEKLGFPGREEGISAHAVVTVKDI